MIEGVELIIRQPGHPDRMVRIRPGETRLGRAEDNDVVLSDVGVSRRHARIMVREQGVSYIDLGSGNGSYVRGRRIEEHPVQNNDEVMIDPFVLTFRLRGAGQVELVDSTLDGSPARLDVVSAPGIQRSYFPIDRAGLGIGRADDQDVILPDPAASRQHCRIEARGSGFVLVDRGSANGVYLNGRRAYDAPLRHGDRVRIGNSEFRFATGDAPVHWGGPSRDMPLPLPESPTPLAPRRRAGSSRVQLFAAASASLVLVALILALVMLLMVQLQQRQRIVVSTSPSGAPHWKANAIPNEGAPDQLFELGRTAIENSKPDEAFAAFSHVLSKKPGDPSAERFALLAAEFQVLDQLQGTMESRALERETIAAKRDALFEVTLTRTARARRAVQVIRAEYRADPLAQAHMGWDRTDEQTALVERLDEANALLIQGNAYPAMKLYRSIEAEAVHEDTLASARAGMVRARKLQAEEVASRWRRGVLAQSAGDGAAAKAEFQKVLDMDPKNPSIAVRTGSAP
ncbi:MAG: FHA domain-containing protein [Proteobacteria bacterium]|nr:FHA domain-containing protein [Pseudomonadota bacterium]